MPTIGLPELIVIAMILVLVFGASRLPQLGEGMGRAIRKLKRGLRQDERIGVEKVDPRSSDPNEPADRARSRPADEPADAEIVDESKRVP